MDVPMDGAKVSYVGDGDDGLAVGDEGKVLSAERLGSHVKWHTGSRAGQITLTHNMDLVVTRQAAASYDNSFDSGLVAMAVRQTYDRRGARGVVATLKSEGHMAVMGTLADDAIAVLSRAIRNDPSMIEVFAHLEDDEQGEVVNQVAMALLKEAFGGL